MTNRSYTPRYPSELRERGIRLVVVTTQPDTARPCPHDKVNRVFAVIRPNRLRVSDFTVVSTGQGTVYVAFVIDVFARKIAGWRGLDLHDHGVDTSVGSVGDSYDNALAESVIGLFKAEVINPLGPWKSMAQVEWQTLTWVHWFNAKRLHSAIGYVTPNHAVDSFYAELDTNTKAA